MNSHRRALANFSWLLGGSFFRSITGLAVAVFVARSLGPAQYGVFQYYIAVLFVLIAVESVANYQVMANKFITRPGETAAILGTGTFIAVVSNLLIILGVFAYYFFWPNEEYRILLVLVIGLMFRVTNPVMCWFNSRLQAGYNTFAQSLGLTISYIATVVVCLTTRDVQMLAATYMVQFWAISAFYLYFFKGKGPPVRTWKVDFVLMKEILCESFPFLISSTLFIVQARVNLYFIKTMLPADDLGVYSVAFQLTDAWMLIASAVVISLSPRIIQATKESNTGFLVKVFALQLVLALGICFGVLVSADIFVRLLYGRDFGETAAVIKILIWSNVFSFWFLTQQAIDVERRTLRLMAYRLLWGLPLMVGGSYLLIESAGVKGAGLIMVLGFLYFGYLSNLMFASTREIFWLQSRAFLFWRYVNWSMVRTVLFK